jgi:hypothetical protein
MGDWQILDLYFYRDPETEENKETDDESKVLGAEESVPSSLASPARVI